MTHHDKTKGLIVIGLVGIITSDIITATTAKPIIKQCEKVQKWQVKCAAMLSSANITKCTAKSIDQMSKKLAKERNAIFQAENTSESLVQELIATDGLLSDFMSKHNVKSRNWRYLAQTFGTLVGAFLDAFPEMECDDLYLRFSDIVRV